MVSRHIDRLVKKAQQSVCKYRVAAIGFDRKGNVVGLTSNRPRISRDGGSAHAEMRLINRYGRRLRTILIIRTNDKGALQPIVPCANCTKAAMMHGIKIRSIR